MKREHLFLRSWIAALAISLLFCFSCNGIINIFISEFINDRLTVQFISYLVYTLAGCISFAACLYNAGSKAREKEETSLAEPVFDQIICVASYFLLSLVFKFSFTVNPQVNALAAYLWGKGSYRYTATTEKTGKMIPLFLVQIIIFVIISLGFYALARFRSDSKSKEQNKSK